MILFATGLQLCWAIMQFDMAVWKQMHDVSDYSMDVVLICSYYCGAIIGNLIGGGLVMYLGKKIIFVS